MDLDSAIAKAAAEIHCDLRIYDSASLQKIAETIRKHLEPLQWLPVEVANFEKCDKCGGVKMELLADTAFCGCGRTSSTVITEFWTD